MNPTEKPSHFLHQIIEADLAHGAYASRRHAGTPGDAAQSFFIRPL